VTLKEARKRKGFTQKYVSLTLGIARSSYSRYENGISKPSSQIMHKLTELFECSVDEFLGEETEDVFTVRFNNELIQTIKALSPENKEKVLEYLEMLSGLERTNSNVNAIDFYKNDSSANYVDILFFGIDLIGMFKGGIFQFKLNRTGSI
jgi:transcriptional regulator with XRE-family HTH domain